MRTDRRASVIVVLTLPADRVAGPPRVCPGRDHATGTIRALHAYCARAPDELRPLSDLMTARCEPVARGLRNPAFHIEQARRIRVRLEGIGEAVRSEARRFHRLLSVHAEQRHVEQHLQDRLRLNVAARSADRHWAAV